VKGGGFGSCAITEHVFDIDHPDDEESGSDERRCQQQAEKPGEDAENDLRRQGQRRRQMPYPSLHKRYEDVTLDEMNSKIEPDHIYRQLKIDGNASSRLGIAETSAAM
jgi:hypothetical protein